MSRQPSRGGGQRRSDWLVTGIGQQANASSDAVSGASRNIAMGFLANASGDSSFNVAIGNGALANGDGGSNVAIGNGAQAVGAGNTSTAIGSGTQANFTNSSAIGAGAVTTRVNQQTFGTASDTYTMAGITSGASKTAQGAPTHLVTSNAGGDLAAYTFSELGLASTGDVSGLQTQINRLGRRDSELTEGIATIASLAQPILRDGQHFGVSAGWGGYDTANAIGISAAGVLADNLLRPGSGTLALYGGVGFGTSEGEVAGRAGMSFGW